MIQRYDIEPECTLAPMNAEMLPDVDGDYVEYADHLAAMAAKDAEIASLKAANWQAAILYGDILARTEKAEQEAAALRADAERYRWLRVNYASVGFDAGALDRYVDASLRPE